MTLVWVHEDAITLDHPAVERAGPAAQPVFIWDTAEHDRRGYTLKRRVFIYECAHELNIPIYAGSSYEILAALSDGEKIYAAETPDPYISGVLEDLSRDHAVEIAGGSQLAHVPANTDTGRFFHFWNRARKSALTPSEDNAIS